MSTGRLFRNPASIGLLSGGLAGAVGIASTVFEANFSGPLEHFEILWNVTAAATLLLLFMPPALLSGLPVFSAVVLLVRVLVFFLLGFALPVHMLSDGWGFLANNVQVYWLIWSVLYAIATGLFLGWTLRRIYRRETLRTALWWGFLSSSANVAFQFFISSIYIFTENTDRVWTPEFWAGLAMATAFTQIVQGTVVAIPFARARKSDGVPTSNDADGKK